MHYTKKSFSVVMGGDAYRDNFDRIFGRKPEAPEAQDSAAPGEPELDADSDSGNEAPTGHDSEIRNLPDLSERQCASCLERNALLWLDPGMIRCGICLARFPQGVEQNMKVPADKACGSCGGTGKLRTSEVAFGCGACGGTGAKGA